MTARYPFMQLPTKDLLSLPEFRTCTATERGYLLDLLCHLHQAPEYGVLRMPPQKLASSTKVPKDVILALLAKGAISGGYMAEDFVHQPRHGGHLGPPVVLVEKSEIFSIFFRFLVVENWRRKARGISTRFQADPAPQLSFSEFEDSPTQRLGDRQATHPPSGKEHGASIAIAIDTSIQAPKVHTRPSSRAQKPVFEVNSETPEQNKLAWLRGIQQFGALSPTQAADLARLEGKTASPAAAPSQNASPDVSLQRSATLSPPDASGEALP